MLRLDRSLAPEEAVLANLGIWEMLIILIVALLIFGRRLPEVSRSFGKAIRQFKRGLSDLEEDVKVESDATDALQDPYPPSDAYAEESDDQGMTDGAEEQAEADPEGPAAADEAQAAETPPTPKAG
jgi:sec-independent protein translocase protein TatA